MTHSTLLPIIASPFSDTYASVSPPLLDWLNRAKVRNHAPKPAAVKKPSEPEYVPTRSQIWEGVLQVHLDRLERRIKRKNRQHSPMAIRVRRQPFCDICEGRMDVDGVYAVRPVTMERGRRSIICYGCARERLIETYQNRARIEAGEGVAHG